MKNFTSTGDWTEKLMYNLLSYLRIPMPNSTGKTVEELLEILPKWRKLKVENGYRLKFDKELKWEKRNPKWVLDKAFKIDCLLEVRPGEIYGFDFTSNPEEIPRKEKEIKYLLPAINKAGISHVAIVYCKIDDSNTSIYSSERGEEIEEAIWEMLEVMETEPLITYELDLTH